ncbi:MAG: carboxypeptidase regulatory-like domain-containing protein [Pyrinomonadaceae bacterium]
MNIAPRLTLRRRFIVRRRRLKFCLALLTPLAFALLAANSPAQTRTEGATGERQKTGAITGRVVGEDGLPLPNVRVSTFKTGGAPNSAVNATSDGDGKFALSNLAFGSYLLNTFAPGYTPELEPTGDPATRTYYRAGDFVTLRMIKGGVITGTVTNANGDPVVGVPVVAVRVRHADGRVARETGSGRPRQTDDRGVYRSYGLRPGTYLVRAAGNSSFGPLTPYDTDAPTYYPSTTRDAASEIPVQAGQETTDIDIRYRGEPGHSVSGIISGALPSDVFVSGAVTISLKHVSASAPEVFAYVQPGTGNHSFSFSGIANGEYDITARTTSTSDDTSAAAPLHRINVRGADVSRVSLTLTPLASISGQVKFELAKSPEGKVDCQSARAPRSTELIVFARRVEPSAAAEQALPFFTGAHDSAPDDKGDFRVRHLQAGRYQLLVRLPAEDFYVRAMTFAPAPAKTTSTMAAAPGKKPAIKPPVRATPAPAANVRAQNGLMLQAGERLTGLTIHLAPGASGLRGRIAPPTETAGGNAPLNAQLLRAHLVPAELEHSADVLRYAEMPVGADGTFTFANLAPGRYWLIARPGAPGTDTTGDPPRPRAWDTGTRAQLRRAAESANVAIDLVPCQHINDFLLPYPAK